MNELWIAIINAATPVVAAAIKARFDRTGTFPTPEETLAELHGNAAKYIGIFDQWLREHPKTDT